MKIRIKAWPTLLLIWSVCILTFYGYDNSLIGGYLFVWIQGVNSIAGFGTLIQMSFGKSDILYEFSLGQKSVGEGHLSLPDKRSR